MEKYQSIINLEHPTSKKHKRMSSISRAAQFAPFAALTGHDEAIKETARLTDKFIELDEEQLVFLNEKLQIVKENINLRNEVTFTYFQKDAKKSGGIYLTKTGVIKRIDEVERIIYFFDKSKLLIDDIVDIKSSLIKDEFFLD